MARRQKTRPAEDLMALVAMLPWWAGVALAMVLYLVLHRLGGQPVATAVQPGQVGAMMNHSHGKTLATFGHHILPSGCPVGRAAAPSW